MRVVVGIDGSSGSLAALRWALEHCRGRRDPHDIVDLVHVYSDHELAMPLFAPTSVAPTGRLATVDPGSVVALEAGTVALRDDLHELHAHEAEELLLGALRNVGGAGKVRVTMTPLSGGDAGRAIVDHAEGADLIVVGARGNARVRHLLGSVSGHCVHHGPCPVVVVPR